MQIKSALTGSGRSEMELYRGHIGGIVDHRQLRSGQILVRSVVRMRTTCATITITNADQRLRITCARGSRLLRLRPT